jgi:hypothetical protein
MCALIVGPYGGSVSPYVRSGKTASGARAVQIVHCSRHGSRDIEHVRSVHNDAGLDLFKVVARAAWGGRAG